MIARQLQLAEQPQNHTLLDARDPLWQNLEAAYYFNTGGGVLFDASPAGRYSAPATSGSIAVTPLGQAWNGARGRGALSTNSYTAIGSGTPISFSVWVTPDGSNTTIDCLLQVGHESATVRAQLSLYLNVVASGAVYVGITDQDFYTAGGQITALTPVHVVVTYAGGNINGNSVVYVNGVSKSLTFSGGSPGALSLASGRPIRIATQTNANRELRGKMHTAHVWSRAITQAEVLRLYENRWTGMYRPQRVWAPALSSSGAYSITAEPGTYSVSGQTASIYSSKLISAGVGSYSLLGQDATITYTPSGTNYTITANSGTYNITGQAATILRSKQIVANAGSYSLTGQNATINYSTGSGTTTLKAGSWIRYRIIT